MTRHIYWAKRGTTRMIGQGPRKDTKLGHHWIIWLRTIREKNLAWEITTITSRAPADRLLRVETKLWTCYKDRWINRRIRQMGLNWYVLLIFILTSYRNMWLTTIVHRARKAKYCPCFKRLLAVWVRMMKIIRQGTEIVNIYSIVVEA